MKFITSPDCLTYRCVPKTNPPKTRGSGLLPSEIFPFPRRNRNRTESQGATLVEAAISLPIFLVALIGLIDVVRCALVFVVLQYAAHQAVDIAAKSDIEVDVANWSGTAPEQQFQIYFERVLDTALSTARLVSSPFDTNSSIRLQRFVHYYDGDQDQPLGGEFAADVAFLRPGEKVKRQDDETEFIHPTRVFGATTAGGVGWPAPGESWAVVVEQHPLAVRLEALVDTFLPFLPTIRISATKLGYRRNRIWGSGLPAERPPFCGDGLVQAGEQCDQGANNSDIGVTTCTTQCQPPTCGDGSIQDYSAIGGIREECEAGLPPPPGFEEAICVNCQWRSCGNGQVDTGEQCDAGGNNRDSGWTQCTTRCLFPRCGDGLRQSYPALNGNPARAEQCDRGSGNTTSGVRTVRGTPTTDCRRDCTIPTCGDGRLDTGLGEECDEGTANTASGFRPDGSIGCTTNCIVPYWNSPNEAPSNDKIKKEYCRDGKVQTWLGEQCDPPGTTRGNLVCNAACQWETKRSNTPQPPPSPKPQPINICLEPPCGDGAQMHSGLRLGCLSLAPGVTDPVCAYCSSCFGGGGQVR